MSIEKKILIIVGISFILTLIAFFIDEDPRNPTILRSVFEIFMMTFLLSGFIAINFFALTFFIKRIKNWLKSRNR